MEKKQVVEYLRQVVKLQKSMFESLSVWENLMVQAGVMTEKAKILEYLKMEDDERYTTAYPKIFDRVIESVEKSTTYEENQKIASCLGMNTEQDRNEMLSGIRETLRVPAYPPINENEFTFWKKEPKPICPRYVSEPFNGNRKVVGNGFLVILGAITVLLCLWVFSMGGTKFALGMMILQIICIVGSVIERNYKLKKIEEYDTYLRELEKFKQDEQELKQWRGERWAAQRAWKNEKYNNHNRMHAERLRILSGVLQEQAERIKEQIETTRSTLEKMVAQDIIYPKYFNLIACSAILEYFETGRVEELTGTHGAYNLYESELRSNTIISELTQIKESLKRIENNQIILYQAIKEVGNKISSMNKEIAGVRQSIVQGFTQMGEKTDAQMEIQKGTYELAAVTAVCAESIAANTEAMKYLAMVR